LSEQTDWIIQLGSTAAVAGLVASILTAVMNWLLEGRKFRREQRIINLTDRIDKFYSPLIFHLENMKSWGGFLKSPDGYAWSGQELEHKTDDMYQIMRSGIRFSSPRVEKAWYDWQPFAIASMLQSTYKEYYDRRQLIDRTQRLHEALKADNERLKEQYYKLVGNKNQP